MTLNITFDLIDTLTGSLKICWDAEVSSESCNQYFCVFCVCFLLEVIQKLNALLFFIKNELLVRDARVYLTNFNKLVGSIFFWKRLTN